MPADSATDRLTARGPRPTWDSRRSRIGRAGGPAAVACCGEGGAGEQATVGSAGDGELAGSGPAIPDELGHGRVEAVEDTQHVLAHPGPVPALARRWYRASPAGGQPARRG